MGWRSAFAYDRPVDVWREHVRLSAYQNDGARRFRLDRATPGNADYETMEPFRWGDDAFADGVYPTPDGRARLVTVTQRAGERLLERWPMTLNTGRYRDQWHTMTRTGLAPRLARHREEPLVEIHPDDVARLDIADGALARVSTPRGESVYRVAVTDAQRPGELFVPIHWTDRGSTGGRTGLLPRPLVDPHSGQPGFKSTPAAIAPVATDWRGFLLMRGEPGAMPDCLWATRVAVPHGTLWELAGDGDAAAIERLLPQGDRIEAFDPAKGSRRIAVLRDDRLAALLFVTSEGVLPSRDWLIAQLAAPAVAPTLLAGRAPGPSMDRGPIVCVCFDIGARAITDAIRADGLAEDVAAVGAALRAGTNCGSCRPAIAGLIADHANRESVNASR